jgi:peptide/nickel transport system substrate-binding protein
MTEGKPQGPLAALHKELRTGKITRREFTLRALALGVGMPIISFILRADTASATTETSTGGRHIGWGVAAQGTAGPPAEGMDGRTRGEGGELKLIQWQAPSMLSPHVSTGEKDYLAAQPIMEPMMRYLPDGTLIPNLITEVPTVENGLLGEDLKSVTYKLLDGVTWADGEPLTADDVVFTWQWVVEPANAATSAGVYTSIESIKAVDPQTVQVSFAEPNANWFEPHAGAWGAVYPKHVLDVEDGKAAHDAFLLNPVGTGPYKIESFSPNDQATYVINENYRDPNKPYFARINLKGGGDAASAARAVLQTGEYDFAWNLQVEPQILAELEKGGKGVVSIARGNSVERIMVQFADPNTETDGERAKLGTANPTMGDKAVRQALNLSAQRDVISTQLYAGEEFEPPTANILTGIPAMESPNTSWEFNIDKAKQILEDAGWTMQGDVRAKDGVELNITFVTTISSVRQKEQAIIKQALDQIGFRTELRQVDAAVFFDSSPGNDQNTNHFYNDLEMYTDNPTTPFPVSYMIGWYGGPEGENIAQASNDWSGQNFSRFQNADYDKLFEQVRLETDLEKAAELFIQMNDILINEVVVVPLVNRSSSTHGISTTLYEGNVAAGPFEYNYWNIANWNRKA